MTLEQYEKPDWYYYLYNLMKVNNKDDIAVDNAVVDHPDTMCGVIDKVKTTPCILYLLCPTLQTELYSFATFYR